MFAGQRFEYVQDAGFLQGRCHAAADQLENLTEKFDFPNSARSELDIVGHAFAFDFPGDHLLHFPQ